MFFGNFNFLIVGSYGRKSQNVDCLSHIWIIQLFLIRWKPANCMNGLNIWTGQNMFKMQEAFNHTSVARASRSAAICRLCYSNPPTESDATKKTPVTMPMSMHASPLSQPSVSPRLWPRCLSAYGTYVCICAVLMRQTNRHFKSSLASCARGHRSRLKSSILCVNVERKHSELPRIYNIFLVCVCVNVFNQNEKLCCTHAGTKWTELHINHKTNSKHDFEWLGLGARKSQNMYQTDTNSRIYDLFRNLLKDIDAL